MINTYKRAQYANKTSGILYTSDDKRLASMDRQAKIERVQRTAMPYKMRLAAIQAISNATAKTY